MIVFVVIAVIIAAAILGAYRFVAAWRRVERFEIKPGQWRRIDSPLIDPEWPAKDHHSDERGDDD